MDPDKFAQVEITQAAQFWDWLADHHAQPESVWLVTWKAAHRDRYVSREAVLDALEELQDLRTAIEAAEGLEWWKATAPSYRRNILRFLAGAKRAQTRDNRIKFIADPCARREKVPQY